MDVEMLSFTRLKHFLGLPLALVFNQLLSVAAVGPTRYVETSG